jgi:GrpB protein
VARHKIFRDWLRGNPDDRALYGDTKIAAAKAASSKGEHAMLYNVRRILWSARSPFPGLFGCYSSVEGGNRPPCGMLGKD